MTTQCGVGASPLGTTTDDYTSCDDAVNHMSPADADMTVAHSSAATDHALCSFGRGDFPKPTHVLVRPPAHWAAARQLSLATACQK